MFSWKYIKENYLTRLIFYLIIIMVGVFIFFSITKYIMPFILAFIFASMLEPLIRLLKNKLKFSRILSATIVQLLFMGLIGFLLYLLISRIIIELKTIINEVPNFLVSFYEVIRDFIQARIEDINWLAPEFTESLDSAFTTLLENTTTFISNVFTTTLVTAAGIPKIIIFIIITLLATYFMLIDREKISAHFAKISPKRLFDNVKTTRNEIFSAIFGWIKAQGILMIITFILLYLGFNIVSWIIPEVNVHFRLTISFITALVDAFPIMGTGTILLPWAIYSFINNDWQLGVCLVGLYLLTVIVRQTIEPRILGRQIGLHPLVTLLSMYLGLQFIGFLGILLGPITALVVNNLLKTIMKEEESKLVDD
jgi:sporulation integral membrane protein YtvI